jgi:hypothetical protein
MNLVIQNRSIALFACTVVSLVTAYDMYNVVDISKLIGLRLWLWCLTPFSTYLSYIMEVSCINGGNRSTRLYTNIYM